MPRFFSPKLGFPENGKVSNLLIIYAFVVFYCSLGIISSLMDHCVEKTLTFLDDHCTRILYANYNDNQLCQGSARGVHEIQRMLTILSSLFDKYILRDNDETFDILDHLKNQRYSLSCSSSETGSGRSSSIPVHDASTVISSFAYSYIWAYGGDLHERLVKFLSVERSIFRRMACISLQKHLAGFIPTGVDHQHLKIFK